MRDADPAMGANAGRNLLRGCFRTVVIDSFPLPKDPLGDFCTPLDAMSPESAPA